VLAALPVARGARADSPPAPADGPPGAAAPAAALAAVDQAFYAAYERAVRESLATTPPTLLVLGGKIVLYRGGNRSELPLLPPLFDELKSVAHVSLGLFATLALSADQPLDETRRGQLAAFRAQILDARSAVAAAQLTAEQRARQDQILAASLAVADQTLAARTISSADLTAFCRRMEPLVLADVSDAVAVYLDEIDRRVKQLLAQIPPADQAQLLVVVSGVHQARIDNAAVQYFERLLGNPPPVAQRVIYAENVDDEAGALHLLGIHLMARRVGDAFFDDATFMNTDLFGHAAKKIVPAMTLPRLGG